MQLRRIASLAVLSLLFALHVVAAPNIGAPSSGATGGGNASGVSCNGCVSGVDIETDVILNGDVIITGSLTIPDQEPDAPNAISITENASTRTPSHSAFSDNELWIANLGTAGINDFSLVDGENDVYGELHMNRLEFGKSWALGDLNLLEFDPTLSALAAFGNYRVLNISPTIDDMMLSSFGAIFMGGTYMGTTNPIFGGPSFPIVWFDGKMTTETTNAEPYGAFRLLYDTGETESQVVLDDGVEKSLLVDIHEWNIDSGAAANSTLDILVMRAAFTNEQYKPDLATGVITVANRRTVDCGYPQVLDSSAGDVEITNNVCIYIPDQRTGACSTATTTRCMVDADCPATETCTTDTTRVDDEGASVNNTKPYTNTIMASVFSPGPSDMRHAGVARIGATGAASADAALDLGQVTDKAFFPPDVALSGGDPGGITCDSNHPGAQVYCNDCDSTCGASGNGRTCACSNATGSWTWRALD